MEGTVLRGGKEPPQLATLQDLFGPHTDATVETWAEEARSRHSTSDHLGRPTWAPRLEWEGIGPHVSRDRTIQFHSWNVTSLRDMYAAEAAGKVAEISLAASKGPTVIQEHRFSGEGAINLQDRLPMALVKSIPALDPDSRHARAGVAFVIPTQLGIEVLHEPVEFIPSCVAFITFQWAG